MHELLWAALTIGRPSKWHVFRHGEASLYEALFRLSLIRMAIQRGMDDRLYRTNAFKALDPTEKGMISYFLGMTCCKLFADQLLDTPWLLHLDVFYGTLGIDILGRSRPDLVGQDGSGCWHAFECKGRSARPSESDKEAAKSQACRLKSVGGVMATLHVGTVAFFTGDQLEFYWKDPEPQSNHEKPIKLPQPEHHWRYYYESVLSLAGDLEDSPFPSACKAADVAVSLHPEVYALLRERRWADAYAWARSNRDALLTEGYHADGVSVRAGESWYRTAYDE